MSVLPMQMLIEKLSRDGNRQHRRAKGGPRSNSRPTYSGHPMMTLDQARASGHTASSLRTLSRTYERLASKGYEGGILYDETGLIDSSVRAMDFRACRNAAYALRRMAKEI